MSIFAIPAYSKLDKIETSVISRQNRPAIDFVYSGYDRAQALANDSIQQAEQFLNGMVSIANSRVVPFISADVPNIDLPAPYESADIPVKPDFSFNLSSAPGDPTITNVAPFSVGQAPQFTATALPLNIPAAPDALTTAVPLAPVLPDVLTPASPNIILPDVPTMLGINIPAAPILNMPNFTATLALSPTSPANTFNFTEVAYTSTLLTSLRARLLEWVNGVATGIDPVVEQAIYDRGRVRENTALGRKNKESIRGFAARGFAKPPGALSVEMADALQDTQNALSALSREVMIKQADLEQSNRRFAFDEAFKVESELITYQNLIAQRSFDTSKYTQQVAIEIFNAEVQRYATDVQAYNIQAQVFKTLIEAELSKLEVYKTELEAQKLIGDLNIQFVEIYKARITAVLSQVEIFKAQVEAANLGLQANKIRIEAFGAQVNAYDSTVKAKLSEYQGYATSIQAEVAKIDLFKGEADAYRSQVEGFRALVDAAVAGKNIEIEVNQRLPMDLFKTRTEVFRIQTEAETSRISTVIKGYEADISELTALTQGEAGRVNAETGLYRAQTDNIALGVNSFIETTKANVNAMLQQTQILIEAIKGGAQVSAQLAAASLSSVNLSGQLGDHIGNNYSSSNQSSANNNLGSIIGDQTFHNLSKE